MTTEPLTTLVMDYAAAQTLITRYYRRQLTYRSNRKDHQGVIDLWNQMQEEFSDKGWPLPDRWRDWERAAEDARNWLGRAAWR